MVNPSWYNMASLHKVMTCKNYNSSVYFYCGADFCDGPNYYNLSL